MSRVGSEVEAVAAGRSGDARGERWEVADDLAEAVQASRPAPLRLRKDRARADGARRAAERGVRIHRANARERAEVVTHLAAAGRRIADLTKERTGEAASAVVGIARGVQALAVAERLQRARRAGVRVRVRGARCVEPVGWRIGSGIVSLVDVRGGCRVVGRGVACEPEVLEAPDLRACQGGRARAEHHRGDRSDSPKAFRKQ